jgi:hypothetical protein
LARGIKTAATKITIKFITELWPTFMKLIDHSGFDDAKLGGEMTGGILQMRWLVLVLFLMLVLGLSQGYPLHGGNGAVNCTVFGAFKDPWVPGYANSDRYMVLNVDLGLVRTNASNSTPIKAIYSLTDGNDRVYKMDSDYTRDLQTGRWLIGFVVLKEAIAKSLTVDPTADALGGEQFIVHFHELSNASNGNVTLLYYGVLKSRLESNKKLIEFDIGLANNGTSKLPLSANNFSLRDQWGWIYIAADPGRNSLQGFPSLNLVPNGTVRSGLVFASLSPLTRPVELVYHYSNDSTLSVPIDPEGGLCSNALAETSSEPSKPADEVSPSSLAGSIKASKARLDKVKGNTSENTSAGKDEL